MSHLDQLYEKYQNQKKAVTEYAQKNNISDIHDGDETYYQLLLKMWKTYSGYRKEKLLSTGKNHTWNTIEKPVLTYRIGKLEEKVGT